MSYRTYQAESQTKSQAETSEIANCVPQETVDGNGLDSLGLPLLRTSHMQHIRGHSSAVLGHGSISMLSHHAGIILFLISASFISLYTTIQSQRVWSGMMHVRIAVRSPALSIDIHIR